MFWPCYAVCGLLVPQPGTEPVPPELEAQSLNHWMAKEVPIMILFNFSKTLIRAAHPFSHSPKSVLLRSHCHIQVFLFCMDVHLLGR